MPLATINNGASSATARASINAAITGLNNASGPGVIYVTKAGNDTTGDGSLAKPFLTPAAAFAYATSLAVNVIVDFGVGSFVYTSASSCPNFVASVRGQGRLTQLNINIVSSSAV